MAYRAYRSGKISPAQLYKDMRERKERKSTRVRKSMSKRPPSEYRDMGHQTRAHKLLAGSGMGFGKIVFPYAGPRELRALSATSVGTRRGASTAIKERGYRYVKIIDQADKNMDGKTGFLTDLSNLNHENRPSQYIITLDMPLANIFLYHTDDESKFVDVASGTKDSARRTRINENKLKKALMLREAMCTDHNPKTCFQKVLEFLGFSSKFTARKKSVKKSLKKSPKKTPKKTPKKSPKKTPKKSLKKVPKKSLKKAPKKSVKVSKNL